MARVDDGKIAVQRGLNDRLGFRKSLENFGGGEKGRARSTYWHAQGETATVHEWVDQQDRLYNSVTKTRCPARTTVGSVEPIGAGLAEAGLEGDGVGVGGVHGAELLDVVLFGQDGAGAVAWLGRSVRWCGE